MKNKNHPNSLKRFIRFEQESIAQFFGLSLIIYALVVIATLLVAFGRYEKINEEKRIHTDGFTLVNLLTAFARSNLESEKRMDLYHVADIVKREKALHYCIIMDNDGKPFVNFGKNVHGAQGTEQILYNALSSDHSLKQVYENPADKGTVYEFSKPIFSGGKKQGVVRIGIIPRNNAIITQLDDNSLSLALLIILPLTPFFYYMFRNTLSPLKALQNKLEKVIAQGEFREFNLHAKGEVGSIAAMINKIVSLFNRKYISAESAKKDLEVSHSITAYEKNKIEAMLDQIGDGVLALNAAGQILSVNKSLELFLNTSRAKLIGTTVDESINDEVLRSFIKDMKNLSAVEYGQKKQSVITHTINQKGTFRFIFAPLINTKGDNIGDLIVIRDITAQVMAEQARSEFLSHAAHEIRSPLTTIKAYTSMLLDGDVKDQETEKEFYNVITMETDRLAKLIEDLLNISKIEMGSLTLKKGMVKPLNLIENCIAAVMSQAAQKNIEIQKLLPDSLSPLDVDKNLMEVALLNCISNSVKYTPEGGSITILAEEHPDRTLFSIKDTGPGISEKDQLHIFDKFYRSADESIQEQKGTGLGLSLTKEIINHHGGDISVESTVGAGSTFTIALPRETDFERMF
jgi:PAS domain S-box-containing protein